MQTYDPDIIAIAVDFGATNMRAGLVRGDGAILRHRSIATPQSPGHAGVLVSLLGDLITSIMEPSDMEKVAGIGISTAGPVDSRKGEVVNPPNIPLPVIPLVGPIRERFSLPVYFLNDCHAGALGEVRFGAGTGVSHFVYLTISTGIGAGVFEQGRLLFGEEGNFAEVGHFTVETSWNLPCGCGGRGHWEGCGSGRFIPAFFQAWCETSGTESPFSALPDAAGLFAAAREGSAVVLRFLDSLKDVQARGISALIAAYDPSLIILDGSVVQNNPDFFESSVIPRVRSVSGTMPRMVMSPLLGNAPLLGAACCVFEGYHGRELNSGDR